MGKRHSKSSNSNRKRSKNKQSVDFNENSNKVDPIFGQIRALPISQQVYDSIKPNTQPIDGETYLAIVRKQAEQSSSVMFHPKQLQYDETSDVDDLPTVSIAKVTNNTIEDEDRHRYHDELIKEFIKTRESIPEVGVLNIPSNFKFPNNFTEWRGYIINNEPDLALISNLDHELTIKLLIYCTKWLSVNVPLRISQWIYSLLVKVSEVLKSGDVSIIRDLAKRAQALKDKNAESKIDHYEFTIEFIIVIVSRFFGQRDFII